MRSGNKKLVVCVKILLLGICLLITTNSICIETIKIGLVGYWKFNEALDKEEVLDSSSKGNDGQIIGDVERVTDGVSGYCLKFNCDDDDSDDGYVHIDINDDELKERLSRHFSVSLWFKSREPEEGSGVLVSKGAYCQSDRSWAFRVKMGFIYPCPHIVLSLIGAKHGLIREDGIRAKTLTFQDKWHHVVVTYSEGKATFYKDGRFAGCKIVEPEFKGNSFGLRIGSYGCNQDDNNPTDAGFLFKGFIDDVRLYNRILFDQEVWAIYLVDKYNAGEPIEDSTGPVPANPDGELLCSASHNRVDLQWDEFVDETAVAGYLIYRDNNLIADVPASATRHSDVNFITFQVRAATNGPLSADYHDNRILKATVDGALQIDGIELNINDIVLIKDQSDNPNQNGIYYVHDCGSSDSKFVLKRIAAFDETSEYIDGTLVITQEGSKWKLDFLGWELSWSEGCDYYYEVVAYDVVGEKSSQSYTKTVRLNPSFMSPLVFPGAEGFGTETAAGRGGHVFKVTDISDVDDGTNTMQGSLSKGVRIHNANSSPMTIVFETHGIIELENALQINKPFLTIAGQTAPSPGITIKGSTLINSHDMLIQHLRFRPGDEMKFKLTDSARDRLRNHDCDIGCEEIADFLELDDFKSALDCIMDWDTKTADEFINDLLDKGVPIPCDNIKHVLRCCGHPLGSSIDGLTINGEDVYNIVIDHCSVSWAIDENIDLNALGVQNVTISNSIISEALQDSYHEGGPHSMGMLIGSDDTDVLVDRVSIVRNLFVHNGDRNPLVLGAGEQRVIVNNMIHNPGTYGMTMHDPDCVVKANMIGNIVVPGPNTTCANTAVRARDLMSGSKLYVWDNYCVNRTIYLPSNDPWTCVLNYAGDCIKSDIITIPINEWDLRVNVYPSDIMGNEISQNVGARPRDRDSVDVRVLGDAQGGGGKIIDSQDEVSGWPRYPSVDPPLIDFTGDGIVDDWADEDGGKGDGMPDAWEDHVGLDKNDITDAAQVTDDGYTNLEKWLHWIARIVEEGI